VKWSIIVGLDRRGRGVEGRSAPRRNPRKRLAALVEIDHRSPPIKAIVTVIPHRLNVIRLIPCIERKTLAAYYPPRRTSAVVNQPA